MNERIWDKFLTERDKAVFAASGYGAHAGFGKRSAGAEEADAACQNVRSVPATAVIARADRPRRAAPAAPPIYRRADADD